MVARKRRQYTAEQQAAVLADAATLGACGAAHKHGVPQSCVSRWASDKRRSELTPVWWTSRKGLLSSEIRQCRNEIHAPTHLRKTQYADYSRRGASCTGRWRC
jgi:transposase-like protein